MAHFEQLNNNVISILMALISSQNLCKLLYYNTYEPLTGNDIEDVTSLIGRNIFPTPKLPSVNTEASSFLTFYFDEFSLGQPVSVKNGMIKFTAIVHNDLWNINGSLRPLSILSEVDKIFNGKRVVGIKNLQFYNLRFFWANDNYSGYQVAYKMASEN